MTGNERVRFCGHCRKHVYNLTAMSPDNAARLIIENEGKLCARMYQRPDGTMLTDNCQIGLRRLRRRLDQSVRGFAACLGLLVGLTAALGNPWRRTGHTRLQRMEPMGRLHAGLAWIERLRNPPPPTLITMGSVVWDPADEPVQLDFPIDDSLVEEIDEYEKCLGRP